jgi:hypothetical protein
VIPPQTPLTPRLQGQVLGRVITLGVEHDDHLESEEDLVLSLVRQRLSEAQQCALVWRLLCAGGEPGGGNDRRLDHGGVDDRRAAGAGHASRPLGGAATPRVCTVSCGLGGVATNVAARQCTSGCASRWRRIADGVRRVGGLTHAVGTLCCLSDKIVRAVHCRTTKHGFNAITYGCNICSNLLHCYREERSRLWRGDVSFGG